VFYVEGGCNFEARLGRTWLDNFVRHLTCMLSNLLSLLELGALLPIHIMTVATTSIFVRQVLPSSIIQMAFEPIQYSDGDNPWVVVRKCTNGKSAFVKMQLFDIIVCT
jgi:hypothetical protein